MKTYFGKVPQKNFFTQMKKKKRKFIQLKSQKTLKNFSRCITRSGLLCCRSYIRAIVSYAMSKSTNSFPTPSKTSEYIPALNEFDRLNSNTPPATVVHIVICSTRT